MNVKKQNKEEEVIGSYVDENGIKVTVYKAQYPRLEELTFPRNREFIELIKAD